MYAEIYQGKRTIDVVKTFRLPRSCFPGNYNSGVLSDTFCSFDRVILSIYFILCITILLEEGYLLVNHSNAAFYSID
jgi:hypothetical protein